MKFRNIYSPDGEVFDTYCDDMNCTNCRYRQVFEYPWRVPSQDRKNEMQILEVVYCKTFSRWAKPYGIDTLLPEPLEYDEENNCLRHEKCIRSEIALSQKEEQDDD